MAWLQPLTSLPSRLRRHVSSGKYRSEIDGLRFFAIAIVVIGHFMERAVRFFPDALNGLGQSWAGQILLHPAFGVYLFFSISGFVLAGQARKKTESPLSGRALSAYFGRRVLRIEPPYIILLVVTFIVLELSGYKPAETNQFQTAPQSLGLSLIGSIFYLHDLIWGTFPRLFPPGWSLEAEVQFYVIAPLLFWAWFLLKSRMARISLGAAILLSSACLSIIVPRQIGGLYVDYGLMRFFPFFWLGILLADLEGWIVRSVRTWPAAVLASLGWLGLIAFLGLPSRPDDDFVLGFLLRIGVYASIAAMFASAVAGPSSFKSFCTRPWVSLIGGACYSLYLTHLQVLQVMTAFMAKVFPAPGVGTIVLIACIEIMIVIAAGLCFYAFLERPFMIPHWPRKLWARFSSHPADAEGTSSVRRSEA